MSEWKIEAVKADPTKVGAHDLLLSFLECDRAWKRLSKPARAAVEAAYPDRRVEGHAGTISSLYRHGFVEWEDADPASETGYHLTPAAREVVRWVVRP